MRQFHRPSVCDCRRMQAACSFSIDAEHGDALPTNSFSVTMLVMRQQVLPLPNSRLGREFLQHPGQALRASSL
ncbi:hypothetical protein NX80_013050 [Xanthomonas vasicola pv. arecae]|nr:hypothetical protein NX80_013050 [Xanthomonas vasicola pv. arecae]AZR30991.1 hypothetical protein KWO_011065 [Xanthomonas vasicola pv. musacearum NCPPB 4379]RRJ41683.1 hypothetical protein EIM46_07635 [Xanthomonas vasicola pv. musacearum]RRJ61267.1 hypothetical protein EIM45_11430 [Xanthomonas vasicola pv. musacearum]